MYLSLFLTALLSATLLPMGSEALLLYDFYEGHPWIWLLIIASFGNTLGSLINYLIGHKGVIYLTQKRWIKPHQIERSHRYFDRYGAYALLLSWVPLIGDPITFIAGTLRYSFWKFILLVAIAKTSRYGVILYLAY
jgi:membrane protein YqaA with SNARE-associated domain